MCNSLLRTNVDPLVSNSTYIANLDSSSDAMKYNQAHTFTFSDESFVNKRI